MDLAVDFILIFPRERSRRARRSRAALARRLISQALLIWVSSTGYGSKLMIRARDVTVVGSESERRRRSGRPTNHLPAFLAVPAPAGRYTRTDLALAGDRFEPARRHQRLPVVFEIGGSVPLIGPAACSSSDAARIGGARECRAPGGRRGSRLRRRNGRSGDGREPHGVLRRDSMSGERLDDVVCLTIRSRVLSSRCHPGPHRRRPRSPSLSPMAVGRDRDAARSSGRELLFPAAPVTPEQRRRRAGTCRPERSGAPTLPAASGRF
jgi:hypothetical protein